MTEIDISQDERVWTVRSGLTRLLPFAGLAFLCIAILFGGSSREAPLALGAIYLCAAFILVAMVWQEERFPLSLPIVSAGALMAAFIVLALAQLIPLPFSLWSHMPGRGALAEGLSAHGIAPDHLPLSLTPESTWRSLAVVLPAIAAFLIGALAKSTFASRQIVWTIILLAATSVIVGVIQVATGMDSWFYFYERTNHGAPVGVLANINHQATLILMTIPFVAARAANIRSRFNEDRNGQGQALVLAALFLLLFVGVLIAQSLAGWVLIAPTLVAAWLVFKNHKRAPVGPLLIGACALAVAAIAYFMIQTPMRSLEAVGGFDVSMETRATFFSDTITAIGAHFPFGSGLGSFQSAYPMFENPDAIGAAFANHAHNDYLEFVMEMGLGGALLIAGAIGWWLWMSILAWRMPHGSQARLKKAASIALGVVILHSFVDYPLRMPAIVALAALCAGILASPTRAHDSKSAKSVAL